MTKYKKYLALAGLVVAVASLLSFQPMRTWASKEGSYIYHTFIMPNTTDTMVVAGSATYTGSFVQGVAGTQNATGTGTSVFPVYGQNIGGEANTECAPYVNSGAGGLNVSSTVIVGCGFEVVIGSGTGTSVITATPSISTTTTAGGVNIPAGFQITLISTQAVGIILQDAGTLSGSQLALGAATRTISKTKTLTLQWEPLMGRWVELGFGNNQGN